MSHFVKSWRLTPGRAIVVNFVIVALAVLAAPLQGSDKLALLVGCSQYEFNDSWSLPGTANDVASFRRLLIERFGFAADDVETLVGWPDVPTERPTYENIAAAFERLIDRAQPGTQVFILLAGHGLQIPLPAEQMDLLDPSNPEPDGFDEAFLAADYQPVKNLIRDNQIGIWLDRLRVDKGAHVWIIFDSCFSGTMTRGGTDEAVRSIHPFNAGLTRTSIEDATARAKDLRATGRSEMTSALSLKQDRNAPGSLVAFYAAQDFETAPDVIRPIGADVTDVANRHGLLSYHLESLLRERSSGVSYGDLGRSLVARYRADGRRQPTPYWEGDLDREVLGLNQWPQPTPLYLERIGDEVRLVGGELSGVAKNTVVAVFHADDKEYKHPVGHLKISATTATASSVEPVAFDSHAAVDLSKLPDGGVCRIVSHDFGDARVKLRLFATGDESVESFHAACAAEIGDEAARANAVFRVVNDSEKFDWLFAVLSPTIAKSRLGIDVDAASGFLLPVEAASALLETGAADATAVSTIPHVQFSSMQLADPRKVASQLADELQKIYAWHNVWRLAGTYSEPSPYVMRQDVHLQIARIKGPEDNSAGQPLLTSQLQSGDSLVVSVSNSGYRAYWYVVLFMNGRYGIQYVTSGALPGRNPQGLQQTHTEREVLRFGISPQSIGTNGFVVIAVSQREHTNQPDYRFLAQRPIGSPGTRSTPTLSDLTSPFEKLLLNTISGRESFRGSQSPDEPQIASWSWVTLPDVSSP